MKARKIASVAIAAAVVAGGAAIVGSSMSSGVFSLTLEQVLAQAGELEGREFKVTGKVRPGSVKQGATPFEITFAVTDDKGRVLDCRYKGTVPDPFAEDREVILQGTLGPDRVMKVSKITVKCPSKYEEAGMSEEDYSDYYKEKYEEGHRKR